MITNYKYPGHSNLIYKYSNSIIQTMTKINVLVVGIMLTNRDWGIIQIFIVLYTTMTLYKQSTGLGPAQGRI